MTDHLGPEPTGVSAVLRGALALVAVALFFTGIADYAFLKGWGPKPLSCVVAFGAAVAVLAASRPDRPMPLLRSPLLAWTLFYLGITTAWACWTRSSPGVLQVLVDRYRSAFFLLACAAVFDEPRARRVAVLGIGLATAFASALNVSEALGLVPGLDSLELFGRTAGLYVNPNRSGLAIVLGLAVAVPALPRPWRLPFLLAGAVGVAATFSRGAELGLALLVVWLLWRDEVGIWPAVALAAVLAILLAAFWGDDTTSFLESRGVLNQDTWARVRLAADDSGRTELALKAWRMFLASPIVGNGLGATRTWDAPEYPHNMYVSLGADHGVLGLLAFPALVLALAGRSGRTMAVALVLLMAGFFSHDLLENGAVLVTVAVAGTAPAPRADAGEVEAASLAQGAELPEAT
jgi:O-Antigen ligase